MKQSGLTKVLQKVKPIFATLKNEQWRLHILQALPFWVASLLTGLLAVGYARLFDYAEALFHYLIHLERWSLFLLTPACFLLAWWVVQKFAFNARGSGIPQVMAAIELANPKQSYLVNRLLGFRIIVVKIISSLLMVLGGGAIGREGPTIQLAGSVFWLTNRLTPERWPRLPKQSFILTGAAAGLAAAFNTPLGGVVFAMEELARIHVRHFRTALFTAVIIAGLTAQAILGPYLYLGYPNVSGLRFTIYVGVVVTAIVSGIGGGLMCKAILKLMSWRSRMKTNRNAVFFITGSALFVAALAFFVNEQVLGSGKELMTTTLFTTAKDTSWHTVLMRFIGPVISFCTGAAGGVFAPSLAAGASIGSFISSLADVTGPNANILILSGMVGFLTGVTRTPFTSAILVLEMTDRHSVIFHLMLAAMFASVSALLIDKHSLYDHLKKQYSAAALTKEEEAQKPAQA